MSEHDFYLNLIKCCLTLIYQHPDNEKDMNHQISYLLSTMSVMAVLNNTKPIPSEKIELVQDRKEQYRILRDVLLYLEKGD